MSQLESLTAFITENMPGDAMQMFESAMDDCELTRSHKGIGLEQRRMGVLRYNARLCWDNFPFRLYSPGEVYALVLVWIAEHANALHEELNLPDPTVDPEFDDEGSCILEIVVPLADPLIIRVAENGRIPYKGQRWEVVNPEIWTASEAAIVMNHGDKS
jgi:hypothetical protein